MTSLCYLPFQPHILLEFKKIKNKNKKEEEEDLVEKLYGFHGKSRQLFTILLKDFYLFKIVELV